VGGLLLASLALLLLHRYHPSKYIWWPKWCANPEGSGSSKSVENTDWHNSLAAAGQAPDVHGVVLVADRAWVTRHAPSPGPAGLEMQHLSPRAKPGTATPSAPLAMPGSSSPLQGGPAGTGQPALASSPAGHRASSLAGAGEHQGQQPGHHRPLSIRAPPQSIVLPAAAAPLLQALQPTSVKSNPQAGSVAPQAVGRPSSLEQPPQQGTARTRTQQLALIERELKDIRKVLGTATTSSAPSHTVAGSSTLSRKSQPQSHHTEDAQVQELPAASPAIIPSGPTSSELDTAAQVLGVPNFRLPSSSSNGSCDNPRHELVGYAQSQATASAQSQGAAAPSSGEPAQQQQMVVSQPTTGNSGSTTGTQGQGPAILSDHIPGLKLTEMLG
jgi:hypothetical protein